MARRERSRLALVAGLLAVALIGPLAAWLIYGWADVERQREALGEDASRKVALEEARMAAILAKRLEALRDTESRRPYFHYQNLFHDPRGADTGASIATSPLAGDIADPIVWTYFQIDDRGELTVPTYNDEVPELNPAELMEDNVNILGALRPMVAELQAPPAPPVEQEVLENSSYVQNRSANQIYRQLKSKAPVAGAQEGEVLITIETMQFSVVGIDGGARLMAMRGVATPDGRLTQGLVLSTEAIEEALHLRPAARLIASATTDDGAGSGVPVALQRGALRVVVEPPDAGALERGRAALGRAFLMRFVPVALLAFVAAALVMLVLIQTERLARQRSRFAAAAAHELRTPLAGLRMYSEMVAEGLGDASRTRSYAQRIADEAARLGRVVSNVLGHSQLERGVLRVSKKSCDLALLVTEEIERQRPALDALGATLHLEVEDEPLELACDRDAVVQVLQNLLDNAEKYTRGCDRVIDVVVRRAPGHAEIAVIDHGPGLEARLARRAFAPFVRGDDRDLPAGIGLGLSLGDALTRAHGGELRHEPTEGGGATFVIALPT